MGLQSLQKKNLWHLQGLCSKIAGKDLHLKDNLLCIIIDKYSERRKNRQKINLKEKRRGNLCQLK